MYALVDCNNFYASCERVFQPQLIGKPIVILSNNDGCIISRSYEAKDLGIPMGAPEFKVRAELKQKGVHVHHAYLWIFSADRNPLYLANAGHTKICRAGFN